MDLFQQTCFFRLFAKKNIPEIIESFVDFRWRSRGLFCWCLVNGGCWARLFCKPDDEKNLVNLVDCLGTGNFQDFAGSLVMCLKVTYLTAILRRKSSCCTCFGRFLDVLGRWQGFVSRRVWPQSPRNAEWNAGGTLHQKCTDFKTVKLAKKIHAWCVSFFGSKHGVPRNSSTLQKFIQIQEVSTIFGSTPIFGTTKRAIFM